MRAEPRQDLGSAPTPVESTPLSEALAESELYAAEGWTWLGAALRALGCQHVFQIPNWKEHLSAELAAAQKERDATDLRRSAAPAGAKRLSDSEVVVGDES